MRDGLLSGTASYSIVIEFYSAINSVGSNQPPSGEVAGQQAYP